MKKIFSFTKKKKHPSDTPDSASRLSVGYELKDKDLGKVHKAALAGDLAKLKQLTKKNDVNQLDKENRTALHVACASGHVEVVHFLVESKAKLNLCDNQNRSALMKAVQGQHDNCVSILLENHADPNLMDINGNTALHLAANIPSVPTAVLLLQHGAQINSQNKECFTPLMVAVRENHVEMAQFLLKETADVNSVDQDQRSPLMIAAGNGEVCMVKLLLQFDADTTLKDTKGCSADNYAGINGHHSCSHLIIEHDTQHTDRASLSHQDLSKKKKKMLSAPSQDLEAGFSLGGPATDRDEHGADEAGRDFEDNSQSESLSRVSKRAADDWPSSDDDDESVLIEKKPLKVDLSKMIASKKGEVASARADTSLSGSDSEPESENRVQRIPSLPKALSSSKSLQHPVDPTPITFLTSASQMTSTPLPHYRKKEDSTEDEDEEEDEDDNDKEGEQDEEEEGDESAENDQLEESGESCDANSPAPDAEVSKEKKRDFLSELGLEGGEDDQSSWSSESHSENLNIDEQKRGLNSQNEGEKEDIKTIASSSNDDLEGEPADQYNKVQKETERAKWEPRNVLSKPKGDVSRKTNVMEELGLGDVDDLEGLCLILSFPSFIFLIKPFKAQKADASDWDSASTASMGALSGHRVASPVVEKIPECSSSSDKDQDKDDVATATLTHQKSISPDKRLPSTPSRAVPQPQPRTQKTGPQKLESEEESDWETENITSRKTAENDNPLQNMAEPQATVKPRSADPSLMEKDSEIITEFEEQQQKIGEGRTEIEVEVQKSSTSQVTSGIALEEAGMGKPETSLGCMSNQAEALDQEQQPEAAMSLAASATKKDKDHEEVGMAEDFDELTQSSDTATDDADSPATGYSHASLLIKKLDSATLDSTCVVKLQNIFHEYERSIKKGKDRHKYLTDKVVLLETERRDLKSSLEDIKDAKSAMERVQLELQTEVTNLKFQLKQEQENHRHTTMKYSTAADKMRRMDEEHQKEIQEMQKVHMNLELEIKRLVNNMKQLEQAHNETQRLLAQERSARTLQENLLSSHLRKHQEIEEENKRNMIKSSEVLSQLTEASDRERELLQQTASLQEQLTLLRTDFERLQTQSSLNESHLIEAREILKEELEEVRRESQLNNETMAQVVFNYKNQVTTLKSELAITTTRLENERQIREKLEEEVELSRTRLAAAVKDAELCLASKSETEKALLREKEEHQRLKDRLTGESASQREEVSSLSQKLAKAESHANSMENEVHRTTMQLTEKGVLLEVLQREKDQAVARVKELEKALQTHREEVSCNKARQEATQERLVQAQSEAMLLRQQLEEAQNKGAAKERAVTDAQERFSDILSKLRSDCEERVQLLEDRNKELASKAVDLRDQVYKLEEDKNERETSLRQLQQELADSLKKLSMSEASLEVNTRYRNDLEEEKTRLLKDLDRLKGKLEESEDEYVQAERRINSLKSSLEEREKELSTAAQKLQEVLSTSAASDTTIKQLEDAVQRLEIENARLEAAAKQQSNKIDALQKGAQEAAALSGCSPGGGVRSHLEDMVTNLQSSKMTLEDQLNREVQKQSLLSHTAQDSRALWEEELKGRSKLGVRLAELEKEKGELNSQMEIEKKKAKKIAEQKKAVDTRLDQEIKRNTELQKEMYRLRTLLKTAKKKVRDQDAGGAEFGSPMSSMRMDLGRHTEGHFGRMKDRVDDLQVQLEKEASLRRQLEKVNEELKDQVTSLKSMSHSNDLLERSKRQLEEEVLDLRRRMETAQVEQSHVEQYRRDAEERARQEIQQKLEQVNLFLQSQAASQEALDQIKAANEASLRSQLEQRIRELEGELGRARTSQQESVNQRESTRTELERYRQLYTEELHLRKSLAAKLERANSRLAEANSKLLNERSRSLITNGSLGAPSLDFSSLASPANYGASLGPLNRNLGLGLSLLNPVAEGQNSRVEDYLAKMQSELDRSITKELNNAAAELDVASARMSPVGSARRELDPVSRATQQYLEVLKKNSMI
ncbi:ankyrin repeat domain-containing protein 26 isoform X7 [Pelmatolapia mariae]|uniref:ankyrin repeat domain-containing protein 26 isoform X7 n=1 Tax=Pelmatolapia mariae TaxID=158779 RepID=UPI002FE5F653